MSVIDRPFETITGPIYSNEDTSAAADQGLASSLKTEIWDKWTAVIDTLLDWLIHPDQLNYEEIIPPSREIIKQACDIARLLQSQNYRPPLQVVPDGEGGISFEFQWENYYQSLKLLADSSVEQLLFRDYQLIQRNSMELFDSV